MPKENGDEWEPICTDVAHVFERVGRKRVCRRCGCWYLVGENLDDDELLTQILEDTSLEGVEDEFDD